MDGKFVIIFVTCGSAIEARRIADALLRKRLIACANIVTDIESKFRWKGKIAKAKEALVVIKTKAGNFKTVEKAIRRIHSYDVPEIIAMPIVAGCKEYLDWIDGAVKFKI